MILQKIIYSTLSIQKWSQRFPIMTHLLLGDLFYNLHLKHTIDLMCSSLFDVKYICQVCIF